MFPLEVAAKADVRLLLSLVMYAAIWLAALLALSLRRPLPAIVVVIVLLAFGFTTDASTRNVWATMAFLLLAGSMLVLSRSLQRERWKSSDIVAGAITATLAAVLAFSIIGATSVDAARPLRDWRTWDIAGVGSTHLRFDWMQNYPRLLDPANNERVMRVRSAVPSYWRANALANFDGQSWWSDAPGIEPVEPAQKKGTYVYAVPPGGVEPPGRVVTESFEVENTYTNDLFIGGWPSSVQISRPVDLRVGDARDLDVDPPLGPKLSYAVTALVPQLEPADLIERGRDYPAAVLEHYSDLPFPTLAQLDGPSPEALWNATMNTSPAAREWLGLYRLNASIVGDSTDPYRIALAVESYLRTKYTYSLTPPQPAAISPYAAFLFKTKSGYCQHFAGAMATLLRFNGIPARVAVGFTTGEKVADGTYVVTRNDAHAWVEAYFPDVGWVPFDPTPGHALPVAGDAPTSGPNAAVAGQNVPGVSLTATPASRGRSAQPRQEPRRRQRRRRRRRGAREWLRLGAVGRGAGARPRRLAGGPRAAAPARPPPRRSGRATRRLTGARLRLPEGPRHRRAAVADARRDRAVPPRSPERRRRRPAGAHPGRPLRRPPGHGPGPGRPRRRSAAACAAGCASARDGSRPCSRSTASGRPRPDRRPSSGGAARVRPPGLLTPGPRPAA